MLRYNPLFLIVYTLLFLTVALLLLAGCDASPPSSPSDSSSGPPPAIPTTFAYETARDVQVAVRMHDDAGTPVASAPLSLYATRGATEVRVASGATDATGRFETLLSLPHTDTHLIARPAYVGFPDSARIAIRDGRATHAFGGASAHSLRAAPRPTVAAAPVASNRLTGTLEFLSPFDARGVPSDLAPSEVITADFLASVNDALPENDPVPSAHPEYLALENETDIRLLDEAEVWVTFVHEGAGYRNTLGFYTYPVSDPPASVDAIDSHTVIFPNVSFNGSGGGLQSGTTVRLGQFPPDTGIGWFLIANGWTGGTVGDGTHVVYSNPDFNPEPDAEQRQHNVQLADTQRGLVLLGFEDMRRDSGSDDDFNDALFYVTSNPVEAIDRSALPETDLEPGDATPPMLTYQPGKDQFASLVFEDLWPAEGDYDFNDMVVDYNVATEATPDGDVAAITATFVTRAAGASFANGFGFSLPVDPEAVAEVTGTDLREGITSTRPNGTEAGTDRAVIMVYDNVHNRVQRAGGFFNTDPNVPYMPPDTITVNVEFAAGVSPADLGTAPYDPFIVVNGDRSREVHLPDRAPTALASPEWFGRSQDTSDPAANRFYKTSANRPWGLHLPASFAYPAEKVDIDAVYLRFTAWAESGGTAYADWYSDPSSAYRNPEGLYTLP